MNANEGFRLHKLARNYQISLADFPPDLKPEHMNVPPGEQAALCAGLHSLHAVIREVYQYFADLPLTPETSERWKDDETCWKAIEGPVKLLWAMGVSGQLRSEPGEPQLVAKKSDLDAALKSRSAKFSPEAFVALESLGFRITYHDGDGEPIPRSNKKCAIIAVSYPAVKESVLGALIYYVAYFAVVKKSLPFEIFLRADFRPLLPGYKIQLPHLDLDQAEIVRMLDPAVREMWSEISHYTGSHYPKYRTFYRVPRLRQRGLIADFSATGKDYGLWSIMSDEQGLRFRIVLKPKGYHYLLDHINELSPRYQEIFLEKVACTDCIRCGKHLFYRHGDHVHRICKGPWYYSPTLEPEDMPDIERLIDIHLANLG